MKKNFALGVVVIILISILAFLKYKQNQSNFSNAEFRTEHIDDVSSIELSDKYGNKTILKKESGRWTVNDSFIADKSKINSVLTALNKLQVELPVSDTMRRLAIDDIRKFGTQVTLKDADGEEIKTIYVGNFIGIGNYMILSKNGIVSPDPYIVKIPGIQKVDLKYQFLTQVDMWISTEIFATPIDKLKEIKITYTYRPEFSFTLSKDEELIEIKPQIDSLKINKQLNKDHVLQFMLEFEDKHFEAKINQDSIKHRIDTMTVYAQIDVTDVFDKKRTLKLYRIPSDIIQRARDVQGNSLPFDIEKYWGYVTHTKDYALVQHYVFGPLLLPYEYFFEEKK